MPDRPPLGRTLSAGVWVSGALVLAGLGLAAAGAPARGGRTILSGILVLIATPLLSVLVLGVRYAVRGERRWSFLCAGLLLLVLSSAWLGRH